MDARRWTYSRLTRILLLLSVVLLFLSPHAWAAVYGAIKGFVRDASTGEALAYANVYLDHTDYGAATSTKGYYYIGNIPPGDYHLVASFVGYSSIRRQITVAAGQTLTVNLELKPGTVELKEVKVSAERARFEREVEVSATRLETKQLLLPPRVGGEQDLFRAVQLLPGVVTTSDFSNRLYIRGGSPDQNLILLDGISVYNPSHLFGIFSPFITSAISDVTLLAGGFPARYGGRLSSVLDVTTKTGNSKRFSGEGSVSLLAASGQVEGPLPWHRNATRSDSAESAGSFLLAGRRTYLPDLLLSTFAIEGLGYYFYDLLGKASYNFSPDSRLTLSVLAAEDILSFWNPDNRSALDSKLRWGNRGISVRWNRVFTPVLYGEALAAWSNFRSRFDVSLGPGPAAQLSTDLTDLTVKSDFTWYLADAHTLDVGFDAKYIRIVAGFSYDTLRIVPQDTLLPISIYLDEKWEAVPSRLFFKPGLRLAYISKGGRLEPEPRLGAKYLISRNTSLNAAVGGFSQPLVTLNSTDAVFSIYDVWLPVPNNRRIPRALHLVTGIEHWLSPDVIAELEAYYKRYSDLLEVRYGRAFTPPESLLTADGYSWGVDFSLRKSAGWITGWANYSFMWTRRNIGREVYHPHYDRRHNLNIVISFPELLWGIDLSARWSLGTGLPFAGTVGYYPRYEYLPEENYTRRIWQYIEGPRDAFRYPVYHRLDASLTRTWVTPRARISAFFDLINVYNSRNVLLYYWDYSNPDQPPVRKQVNMLPILPTLGVRASF